MSTPSPFPHRYEMEVSGTGDSIVATAGPRPGILGGPPPEFGGREDRWSPEHLLLASLNLCLATTFESFARRARVEVFGYRARASAVLDKRDGRLVFTGFDVAVELDVRAEDGEKARELVEKAKKHCVVSNALQPPVRVRVDMGAVR